jgi:putative CocE/NonD family hydrolase
MTLENVWIPLSNGYRLGMRLWLPKSAYQKPVPVVLEYLPYRKRDLTRSRDDQWGYSFTPYGFAYARVDIRGSGSSDGVLLGEYLQSEQDDAVEVIAWLAQQPWCNGAVGMRGISWGGFNTLQVAAREPPALKGIVTQCATDNRYTGDCHYMGGALLFDGLEWAAELKIVMTTPPDPAIVGDRWKTMWMERLKPTPPVMTQWLSHQTYDAFWQHGSVAMDYSSIKCPMYAVDGQLDSYRDFLPRVLENINVPRKGVFGPWTHHYPQNGNPGPGLDWVIEEVRWWTQWLKGIDTGIMDDPMLWSYMETQTASEVWPKDVPGRWVADKALPSLRITPKKLFLNAHGLGDARAPARRLPCRSQETVGLTLREWYPDYLPADLPPDQTPDDVRSVLFDSAPLDDDLEILGNPSVMVRLESDQPIAHLAVRINEVLPNGKSWCVSYGILNLTHRNSDEHPEPLVPGTEYNINLECKLAAHRFKKGSRIRVAVTESLWPLVWPSPRTVTLTIITGESYMLLPVRPRELENPAIPIPVIHDAVEKTAMAMFGSGAARIVQTGPDADGRVSVVKYIPQANGPREIAGVGTVVSGGSTWTRSIREGDPNSSAWNVEWTQEFKRGDWNPKIKATVALTSTAEEFRVRESIAAWEGSTLVFERAWDTAIKRDMM